MADPMATTPVVAVVLTFVTLFVGFAVAGLFFFTRRRKKFPLNGRNPALVGVLWVRVEDGRRALDSTLQYYYRDCHRFCPSVVPPSKSMPESQILKLSEILNWDRFLEYR